MSTIADDLNLMRDHRPYMISHATHLRNLQVENARLRESNSRRSRDAAALRGRGASESVYDPRECTESLRSGNALSGPATCFG